MGLGSRPFSIGTGCLALLFLTGCTHLPPASNDVGGGGDSAARSPLSSAELRTTDGAIAVANLEAQIDGEEGLAAYRPLTVVQRAKSFMNVRKTRGSAPVHE